MTAQIALLNQRCAAVASDSILTIGSGARLRTMSTADKMFDTGPGHSVAVLHSGSASFMQVHYEVLLTEWRRSLGDPLPSLADYAASFSTWLVAHERLFGTETQEGFLTWLLDDIFLSIRNELARRLDDDGLTDEPWDTVDVVAAVNSVVSARADLLSSYEPLPDIDADATIAWVLERQELISKSFSWVFDDVPRTESSDRILMQQIPRLIVSHSTPWDADATVTFVGFGADDTFPGYVSLGITGIINNTLLARPTKDGQIAPSSRGMVTTFGQDEAVHTFIRAYNHEFLAAAHRRLDSVLNDLLPSNPIEAAAADVEVDAEADAEGEIDARSAYHQKLDDDFTDLSWDAFVRPMLETIRVLPPADMLRMAESLVGIQALRAASSNDLPSVGGPIDLALITREHGVQWVRRKDPVVDLQRER